jgi:hypothetical protein
MIYDKFLQSMVENAAYVKAYWSDVGEDQYRFRDVVIGGSSVISINGMGSTFVTVRSI